MNANMIGCILVWQVKVQRRQEALQVELEQCGEDMDKMAALLDEMEELNKNATDLDMTLLDRNIDKMMPELGFTPEDSDQLVAAYRCSSSSTITWTADLLQSPCSLLICSLLVSPIPISRHGLVHMNVAQLPSFSSKFICAVLVRHCSNTLP